VKINFNIDECKEIAWAIATEGGFSLGKTKRGFIPCIYFVNTDITLFGEFIDKVKIGNTSSEIIKENHKRKFKWYVSNIKDVSNLCSQILPYLPSKQKQASILLEYCKIRLSKNTKGGVHVQTHESREFELYHEIKQLNRRGFNNYEHYDTIIIGSGPSALAFAHHVKPSKVLLLEKGCSIEERYCPSIAQHRDCARCKICSITSGWGGAGAFSDGKLVWGHSVGGSLNISENTFNNIKTLFSTFTDGELLHPSNDNTLIDHAAQNNLEFIPTTTYHLGTDNCKKFCKNIYDHLKKKIDIILNTKVVTVEKNNDRWVVNEKFSCNYLVVATGREGSEWFRKQFSNRMRVSGNVVDLGIRLEVPNSSVSNLVKQSYDFKIKYVGRTYDDVARTFCVNPSGFVIAENNGGLITCNGHSKRNEKSNNTNFAIVVSIPFEAPIDSLEYSKDIVKIANNISKSGMIVQRYGDLKKGRRTTDNRLLKSVVKPTFPASPGDLSLVIPHRYLKTIIEMIEALARLAPSVASDDTLLYGVEIKLFNTKLPDIKPTFEILDNFFVLGDGSGVSRGIIQAAASGLIAADEINRREGS
jgi:uncharacterized protein